MALRSLGHTWRAAILALLCLAASVAAGSAQAGAPESAIKATYLYKFAPFVDWPASAFPSQSSPFYLCVMSDDPLGAVLDHAVSSQRVGDHRMTVRRIRKAESASGCHILYLGASADKSTADTLRLLKGAPVLTVSDHNTGIRGAIIRFIMQDGRVRFDIDKAAAAANGVTISSKLLSLAISVGPGG
jgi:hypothetical protein